MSSFFDQAVGGQFKVVPVVKGVAGAPFLCQKFRPRQKGVVKDAAQQGLLRRILYFAQDYCDCYFNFYSYIISPSERGRPCMLQTPAHSGKMTLSAGSAHGRSLLLYNGNFFSLWRKKALHVGLDQKMA